MKVSASGLGGAKDMAGHAAGLTAATRVLLQLMIDLQFGRIEGICVHNGTVVYNPLPTVVRTVKFGACDGRRASTSPEDLALKPQVVSLLDELASIKTGHVLRLEVRDGLPAFMEVAVDAGPEVAHA
jgi:hypothetical protein